MTTLIDWAEAAGQESIRATIAEAEYLTKEAHTTLTLLVAGFGASLAYVVKAIEAKSNTPLAWAVGSLVVWLMVWAVVLIFRCLMVAPIMPVTNNPQNLYQDEHPLDQLRRWELENLTGRISFNTQRNKKTAGWLNAVRLAMTASPVVFAVCFGIAYFAIR